MLHCKLVRRSACDYKVINTVPWTYAFRDLNGE